MLIGQLTAARIASSAVARLVGWKGTRLLFKAKSVRMLICMPLYSCCPAQHVTCRIVGPLDRSPHYHVETMCD